jgi:peptidoglycan/LPS O-acetylase OafA/YrhL
MVCSIVIAAIFWFASQYESAFLRNRVLLFLGACSYPLYVVHQNIGFIEIRYLENIGLSPLLAIAITAATIVALASVISRWIEVPSNRFLRSLYRRSIAPDVPATPQPTVYASAQRE